MDKAAPKAVRLTGPTALRWGLRIAQDPLLAARDAFDAFGPLVVLGGGSQILRTRRIPLVGVPIVLISGAALTAALLSNTQTWRGTSLLPGGPRGSAARRMSAGLTRLTGQAHAHYRKLVLTPLRGANAETLTQRMADLAQEEVASWPLGESADLWDLTHRLMRKLALKLLFGGDTEQARSIADLVSTLMERKWSWKAFVPVNISATTYGQIVRESELLEQKIRQWVAPKRGRLDPGDFASIIVNSPDPDGKPADDAVIMAQLASLFAASFEAAQSVLTWTLVLLSQHPHVAARLGDELTTELGGSAALADAVELPYLDAVVRESMRILPPVPAQVRVAEHDTSIAGYAVPRGTRVLLSTLVTNRAAELYPDADVFMPGRWSSLTPTMYEFPVFSAGPHACPGYWFGSNGVKIALAAILIRCRVQWPPGTRIDYRAQPTLRPKQRLTVTLHRADTTRRAERIDGSIHSLVKLPEL
jgi:cytochrome P450